MNEGWICPRCGKVNAPWMPQCTCSNNNGSKITCGQYKEKQNKKSVTNEYVANHLSADEQMICS